MNEALRIVVVAPNLDVADPGDAHARAKNLFTIFSGIARRS